jgi:hypothetical protein
VFSSYRDPKLKDTLTVYEQIPEYITQFEADEREMTKYIIGTINELDVPLNPMAKGNRSYQAYLCHITEEQLQKERDEILNCTPQQIRELADVVRAALEQRNICVIGNEQMIEREQEVFDTIEKL